MPTPPPPSPRDRGNGHLGLGAIAHDVKGDGFKSKVMTEGTFSHRFTKPGTYKYVRTLHPNMTGTIEVTG